MLFGEEAYCIPIVCCIVVVVQANHLLPLFLLVTAHCCAALPFPGACCIFSHHVSSPLLHLSNHHAQHLRAYLSCFCRCARAAPRTPPALPPCTTTALPPTNLPLPPPRAAAHTLPRCLRAAAPLRTGSARCCAAPALFAPLPPRATAAWPPQATSRDNVGIVAW